MVFSAGFSAKWASAFIEDLDYLEWHEDLHWRAHNDSASKLLQNLKEELARAEKDFIIVVKRLQAPYNIENGTPYMKIDDPFKNMSHTEVDAHIYRDASGEIQMFLYDNELCDAYDNA